MNPQLVQNGSEKRNPAIQITKAMKLLGYLWSSSSLRTVVTASVKPNEESIPRVKRVVPSIKAQKFGQAIRSTAVG